MNSTGKRTRTLTVVAQIEQCNVDATGELEDSLIRFDGFVDDGNLFSERAWRTVMRKRSTEPPQGGERWTPPWLLFSMERADVHRLAEQKIPATDNRWWVIELKTGKSGVPATVLGESGSDADVSVVSITPLGEDHTRFLHWIVRTILKRSSPDIHHIKDLLEPYLSASKDMQVCVVDVGQGALAAVHPAGEEPRLFFDLGWPLVSNLSTAPRSKPDLSEIEAPVVLSHWDWDHWGLAVDSAKFDKARFQMHVVWSDLALARPWIVPGIGASWGNVSIGASHIMLAIELTLRGNLYVWPSTCYAEHFPYFSVYRPQRGPSGDRNQHGLVGVIHRSSNGYKFSSKRKAAILLPGDADYPLMPFLASDTKSPFLFRGLMATHHGGRFNFVPAMTAGEAGVIAFSSGTTDYGHPRLDVQASYLITGQWRQQLLTKHRVHTSMGQVERGNVTLSTGKDRHALLKTDFSGRQ